ncbi:MAG: cytochrome c oxidase subunit II [Acidimicrobiales bacterium]
MSKTDEETPTRPRINWTELITIWLVLTAVTVAGSLLVIPRVMPRPASSTMHLVVLTMLVFSAAAAPVGSLVYATCAYSLRHWRHGSGDEPPPDGPSFRGNTALTSVWLSVSALLCVFLLVWGLAALAADDSVAGRATMQVDVTGQQWLWTFHYPGTDVTTEDLYLPEGRTVTFDVTSLDVTHGFWIVQMGVKIDANPGVVTTVSVTPDRLGTYDIRCSELCGLYHAFMTAQVHVVTPSQFETWLGAQSEAEGAAR